MRRSTHACLLGCGLLALTACAEGTGIDDEGGAVGQGGAGEGGAPATSGSVASTTGPGPSSSSASTGGSHEGGMEAGGGATSGGAGEGGGPPPMCNFVAPEDCAGAEPLPAIAGDEGTPIVTRTGDSSKWFKIHIEEQNSSFGGDDISYTVSLTSPAGMNYDLKVRQGAQEGDPECNATVQSGVGNPEAVSDSWSDDQGFGGEDDSVWLVIEVVHVSGEDCGSGAQWTLEIRGNT